MSALAQWLASDGWVVSGTDRAHSSITDTLTRAGIPVDITESPALPRGVHLLVYSDAVPATHPLREAARAATIRTVSYPELLGELTRPREVIAVSGSHGKSTTTALVGLMLEAAGMDPTVVVGTRVPQWQRASHFARWASRGRAGNREQGIGNYRRGASSLAVVEADEYRRHFLTLSPRVAVVTSVDYDHVDAFPSPKDYQAAYAEFLSRVAPEGTVVLPAHDPATPSLRSSVPAPTSVLTFAVDGAAGTADVIATNPVVRKSRQEFRLFVQAQDRGTFALSVPGEHVVSNAVAAVAAALPFGVEADAVRRALAGFRGTWRRFELVGEVNGALVISDYAHHPTELRALAAAARAWYPGRRLVIAFQPHQHARTRAFSSQFIRALEQFDAVILAEVYDVTGREESERVTTKHWVELLSQRVYSVTYAPTLGEVESAVRSQAQADDVVLIVGAGDIDSVARQLVAGNMKNPSRGDSGAVQ